MSNKKTGASAAPRGNTTRREQLRQQQEAEARRSRTMRMVAVAAAVLALALVAVVGTVLYQNHQHGQAAAGAQVTPPNANADKSGITIYPGKAKAGAPTMVVYQDYQCPVCKQVIDVVGTWTNELAASGDVKVEYRTMQFLDLKLHNDSSSRAAVAADCADTVGAYVQYHDAVYANQPTQEGGGYTDQQLTVDFAKQAGITGANLTKFQSCYNNKATKDFATGTDDAANKAGIEGTPTYRVNGHELDWRKLLTMTSKQQYLAAIKATA